MFRERIGEARDELMRMLAEDELREAVLLIFANKQDLPNAMNAAEITDKLGLHSLRNRNWYIQVRENFFERVNLIELISSGNLRNFWGRAVRGAGLAQQPVEKCHALGQTCHHIKKLYPIVSLESIQVNTNQRKKDLI